MSDPFDVAIQALRDHGCDPHQNGDGYKSRCPAHEDHDPSLTINRGDSGAVLLKCRSQGCSLADIVKAIGLKKTDLFPPQFSSNKPPPRSKPAGANGKAPPKAKPAAENSKREGFQSLGDAIAWKAGKEKAENSTPFPYNENFAVVRFDFADGSKTFSPFRRDPDGWLIKDPKGKLPLYHLDDLAGAETVYVFEGEKCAELARDIGLVATTSAHGSKSAAKSDWTPLAGKTVFICPDHDEPGKKYAHDVAMILSGLDAATRIKIVELPGLGSKEDIVDWLEAHDAWDSGQCRAELERLAAGSTEWARPAEPAAAAGGGATPSGSTPEIDRLEVLLTPNESVVNDQAASALARIPDLYQRDSMLVKVKAANESKHNAAITRAPGAPTIRALTSHTIRSDLTRAVKFVKAKLKPNGEPEKVHCHPPAWCVSAVAARDSWDGVPHLAGLAEMPFLRDDGSLVTRPGFDQATGILYIPSCDFPPGPENPNQDDARKAADVLFNLVQDFPFLPGHKAAFLAALLTPIARFLIDGPCPLFLFDAPTAGSGKTLLADIVSITTTGREMSRTGYQHDPVETDKQIVATCIAGDRLVLFDNLENGARFGNPSLDRALTSRLYRGRLLGQSEMKDLAMDTVFFASGNNVNVVGDIARRIIPCRLVSDHERPESRPVTEFAIASCDCGCNGEMIPHAKRKRPELATAALTILRAYHLAGKPTQDLPSLDFPAWSRLIRGSVFWATGIDPAIGRKTLVVSDQTREYITDFVHGWFEVQEDQQPGGLTSGDMRKILGEPANNGRFTRIHEAISGLWPRLKPGELPSSGSLGKKLQTIRDMWCGNKKLVRLTEVENVVVWQVQTNTRCRLPS